MSASMQTLQWRSFDLPWTGSPEQEQRFWRLLRKVMLWMLPLCVLMPLLPVPERAPFEIEQPPERIARMLMEERHAPPPPPPPVQEIPREEAPAQPLPEPVVQTPPVPMPVPDPVPAPVPVPESAPAPVAETPPPQPAVAEARERAASAGLLPLADALADLRTSSAAASVTSAAVRSETADTAVAVERAMVTSRAGQASGGVVTAELSRDTGGSGLAGRESTRVDAPVAGATGDAEAAQTTAAAARGASRSREEIEQVFDRNRGAIYAIYNRALREDPTLQGKLLLRLTIAPDGSVTDCEVLESELNDPELERRLVQRILLFQFEAKDVAPVTTTKPIEFFPA